MKTHPIQSLSLMCLFLTGLLSAAPVTTELSEVELKKSIVHINTFSGRQLAGRGTGFVVQSDSYNGYVVTNARLVNGKDTISVSIPGSNKKLIAQIIIIDPDSDFALLKVNGLNVPPLKFTVKQPGVGDVVWSAVRWEVKGNIIGLSKGNVNSIYSAANNLNLLSHDANIGESGVGSVLLNNCGEVVGLNSSLASPDANARAINASSLVRLVRRQNIRVSHAEAACVPALAAAKQKAELASTEARRARKEAELAQQTTRKLEKQIRSTDQRNVKLAEQVKAASVRADQAIATAADAQELADQTRIEMEKKSAAIMAETQAILQHVSRDKLDAEARFQKILREQAQESAVHEKLLIGAFLVFGLVMIALMFVMLRSFVAQVPDWVAAMEPKNIVNKLKTEFGRRGKGAPEYILDGNDDVGMRYNLRIPAEQMTAKEGVVVGRNPEDALFVINHGDVSRRHIRLKAHKQHIFIEDLGSTNGTVVNGNTIDQKGMVSINSGDQIVLGGVVLKLRVESA